MRKFASMTPNPANPSAKITYAVRDAPTPPTPTYLISGVVTSGGGSPGFVTALEFTGLGTYFTASNGTYGVTVTQGYSGTVIPHYLYGDFSPQVRIYSSVVANASSQNYAYTAYPLYTISGTVARNGTLTPGIGIEFTSIGTAVTNSSGSYSQSVPAGYTGNGIPHYSAGSFTPSSRSYSGVAANATGQHYALYVTEGTETVVLNRAGAFALNFAITTTTGYYAVQDINGVITVHTSGDATVLDFSNTSCTVWSCFSATDTFNYGHITLIGAASTQGFSGAIDLSQLTQLIEIIADTCDINDVTITSANVALTSVILFNNLLDTTAVNAILVGLDSTGAVNGSVSITGNQAPSGAGLTAKTSLQGKGWTVDTD